MDLIFKYTSQDARHHFCIIKVSVIDLCGDLIVSQTKLADITQEEDR